MLGFTRETLADVVVNALTTPGTSDKHIALLKSATTADEWRTAEQVVQFGRDTLNA